jgi:hypothetical protein
VRQAHIGLKRLVCGFYHADDHLEVVFALNFVQFDIFVLQPVLDSLLEVTREGNVHFFQPSIRGYVVFQSRHRPPLDYLQGRHSDQVGINAFQIVGCGLRALCFKRFVQVCNVGQIKIANKSSATPFQHQPVTHRNIGFPALL